MLHPRARTMLLLAVPALIIGVASSLVLIVVMKVAAVLQTILWTALPVKLGISTDSPKVDHDDADPDRNCRRSGDPL